MTFKPGAFIPGAPIQPIVLRFSGWDTYTWTFGQRPTNLALLVFLSLSQPVIRFTMEYLPVYKPDATERQDPMLYARNVRRLMAKSLNVPVSDWTFENGFLLDKALQLGLPPRVVNFNVHKLCKLTGLSWRQIRALLVEFHSISQSGNFILPLLLITFTFRNHINHWPWGLYSTKNRKLNWASHVSTVYIALLQTVQRIEKFTWWKTSDAPYEK